MFIQIKKNCYLLSVFLYSSSLIVVTVLAQDDAGILFNPNVTTIELLSGVGGTNIICSYSSSFLNMSWFKEETEVIHMNDAKVFQEYENQTQRLFFGILTLPSDSGNYICKVNTSSSSQKEKNLNVSVAESCTVTIPDHVTSSNCTIGDVVNLGKACAVSCKSGYYINITSPISCDAHDTWSQNWDDACPAVTCNISPNINNGTITGCPVPANYPSICNIKCNDGYYIIGDGNTICVDANTTADTNMNGKWERGSNKCEPVTCLANPVINNGEIIDCDEHADYSLTCNIKCNVGYYITDDGKTTCLDANMTDANMHGEWDDGNNTCEQILCTVTLPEHGLSNCSKSVAINTTCSFECNSGYSANETSEQRLCENVGNADGEWDINWESATCNDIDECKTENQCDSHAECENVIGSYFCVCNQGYNGDGNSCVEIEEQTVKPPESKPSTIVIVSSIVGGLVALILLTVGIAIYFDQKLKSEQNKITTPAEQEMQDLDNGV